MAKSSSVTLDRRAAAQNRFLRAFTACGIVGEACKRARVGRRTLYHWLDEKADADFRQRFQDARDEVADTLEAEARRRATVGVDEPVYQGGALVGHVRRYSDHLLMFLLKAARPDTYRDRFDHRVSGPGGKPLKVGTTVVVFGGRYRENLENATDDELARRIEQLQRLRAQRALGSGAKTE